MTRCCLHPQTAGLGVPPGRRATEERQHHRQVLVPALLPGCARAPGCVRRAAEAHSAKADPAARVCQLDDARERRQAEQAQEAGTRLAFARTACCASSVQQAAEPRASRLLGALGRAGGSLAAPPGHLVAPAAPDRADPVLRTYGDNHQRLREDLAENNCSTKADVLKFLNIEDHPKITQVPHSAPAGRLLSLLLSSRRSALQRCRPCGRTWATATGSTSSPTCWSPRSPRSSSRACPTTRCACLGGR